MRPAAAAAHLAQRNQQERGKGFPRAVRRAPHWLGTCRGHLVCCVLTPCATEGALDHRSGIDLHLARRHSAKAQTSSLLRERNANAACLDEVCDRRSVTIDSAPAFHFSEYIAVRPSPIFILKNARDI